MSKMKKLGISLLFVLLFVLPVHADTICDHQWSEWEITEESDCESTGSKERYCELCDEWEEQEIAIDPNAHEFSEWYTKRKATALKAGKKVRECENCGYQQSKTIAKLKAKVTLKKSSLSLNKKATYTLKIKSKTYGDAVKKWKSKNSKIASVSQKGKVTAKKKGTTTITLYMKSGAKVSCKVTVTNKTAKKTSNKSSTSASGSVWIPRTGSKYHKSSKCSNMKNPSKVTLKQAKSWGYTACKKCY